MKRGIILTSVAVAILAGALYARSRAQLLLQQSRGVDPQKGIVRLELASRLDPFNNLIIQELAAKYETTGQPLAAIGALRRNPVGESGDEIVLLQLRTGQVAAASRGAAKLPDSAEGAVAKASVQLEEGRAEAAIGLLENQNGTAAQELLILARASEDQASGSRESDSEALRALRQGSSDNLFLAQAFYVRGLLNSAERALDKYKEDSGAEDYLRARIALDKLNDNKRLNKAKNSILSAIKKDPGNLVYHKLAHSIYLGLKDPEAAKSQQELINDLK